MKNIFFLFILLFSFQAKTQNALHFDGNNDYVNLNSISSSMAGLTEFTVDFWLKFDIADNQNYNIFFSANTSNYDNLFLIRAAKLSYDNVYDVAVVYLGGYIYGTTPIGDGDCHHIALSYNNGVCKLYVDGNLETTVNNSISFNSTNLFSLGQEYDNGSALGTSQHYEGLLKEFRIWDIAKTNSEVLGLMNLSVNASTPNLISHFDFDEGNANMNNSGLTTTTNTVSNGNGTLVNFSLNGTASNYVSVECEGENQFYNHQSTIEICDDFYVWNGNTYTESGLYIDTVYSTNQDTIFHLNLTILNEQMNTLVLENNLGQLESQDMVSAYQWLNCEGNYSPISGETNQIFEPLVDGTYAVELTLNGCVDTSMCYLIKGVSLEEESNLISLYPNPTNGKLTFIGLDETQNYIFQVYSTLGVLLEKNMELKANETIQLAYPKGYYILQVLNTNSKERFNYSVLIE